MATSAASSMLKEICKALGLKYCRKLDLHMEVGSVVTGEVEFYPEKEGLKQSIPVFQKFELTPIGPEKKLDAIKIPEGHFDTTCIGDEYQHIEQKGEYGLDGPGDCKAPPPKTFKNENV